MTATPETTTSTDTQHHFLTGLAQQADYAHGFAKAGRTAEALEHLQAIERLIAAYRDAIHVEQPGVIGNELVVQRRDGDGHWVGHGGSIPGLFLEEGKRLLKQARTGYPQAQFRLVRFMTLCRIEEIPEQQDADGGA